MKTDATFSVDFVMRKKKNDPRYGFIYARITVNGDIKEVSLKEEVLSSTWIPQSESIKGKNADVQKINDYIDDVRSKIRAKYRELQYSGKPITAQLVKEAYLGQYVRITGHTLLELLAYHEKINTGALKPGTMKNYVATESYVKELLKRQYKLISKPTTDFI